LVGQTIFGAAGANLLSNHLQDALRTLMAIPLLLHTGPGLVVIVLFAYGDGGGCLDLMRAAQE